MSEPERAPAPPSADALLEAMSEAVYVVDLDRTITYWNPSAEQITGYSAAEVVGRRCRDDVLNHVDECGNSLCRTRCPLSGTMLDGQPREASAFLHHHDGHRVPVAMRSAALRQGDGSIIGAVEVFHDDTSYRALSEQLWLVEREALTDMLTGVPNRRGLRQTLRLRHDEHVRYGRSYAVLFVDVDNFKAVNDRYGHDVGDRVLRLVAATLRDCTRGSDSAGRWGGDEFVLVIQAPDIEQAEMVADRARRLVASTWTTVGRHRVTVNISVGVALARTAESSGRLVDRADRAMLATKRDGGHHSTSG